MSDFFDEPAPKEPPGQFPPRRSRTPGPGRGRPRPLLLTIAVLVVIVICFSLFTSIWTDRLWFNSINYGSVFTTLLWTRILLFATFGFFMALVVGANLYLAFRLRPLFRPHSPEQAGLDRYREVVLPIRRALLISTSLVIGLFAGGSAAGRWRTYLLWEHRQSFGKADPYFHKDIGFYVFSLPWLHYLVDFAMTAVVFGLLAAVLVHYLFGGIRLQANDKFSGAAQAQISVLLGVFVLLKAGDYYFDRFDLTSQDGPLITGMTYARDHAVLPSKNILMAIAVICAILFFANVFRRTWLLPGVGVSLFALSAILLGLIWPAIVQRFQVNPSEADKESSFIANNIKATRDAFGLDDSKVTVYNASDKLSAQKRNEDAASLPGIRLVDPQLMSDTFEQLQQLNAYYTVPGVLDIDRYPIDGRERDLVVAARDINLAGLPDDQKNWANIHTVYTHGYGMIAAYGNQRDAQDNPIANDTGAPIWAEKDLPPVGQLGSYRPQIYFGENSPDYSIVGQPKGGGSIELDLPQGSGTPGESLKTTYAGKDGVSVASTFRQLLYAVKFSDPNIFLSSRVHADSKILYNRSPRERVQKVAPWLTVDSDALPAVVDGKIVWILDGYTTTDRYPLSEKRSLQDMTSDAINPRSAYATLPTDEINYMRNSVKAVVDAYDGTVTLYQWDGKDPILKAWEGAFPGVVKPKSDIPPDLLAHMRYPEDLFKVQREMLAAYHVTDPKTFYEGSDKWQVPEDPTIATRKQPPYRLSVSTTTGGKPIFSLTSVYEPNKKQNLASFISVAADAADPSTYGKIQILRLQDNAQVPGPSQIANNFTQNSKVAEQLQAFKRANAKIEYGNLLTLPVGGGLLYVEPLYTLREGGSGNYPVLAKVLVSFGSQVGIGQTLSGALDDILGTGSTGSGTTGTGSTGTGSTGNGGSTGPALPVASLRLLQQADQKFAQADKALRAGDLNGYAQLVDEGRALVKQALAAGKPKAGTAKKK